MVQNMRFCTHHYTICKGIPSTVPAFCGPIVYKMMKKICFFLALLCLLPLLILFAMHLTEYLIIGRKVAAEKGLSVPTGLAQCLSFGFTWWLPLKKG